MSTLAIRLAFDHACAPAAWLSIAADIVIGEPFSGPRGPGACLFQRLFTADAAARRGRRSHFAVRTRARASRRALPTAQIPRNHARISRSNDPCIEALETRHHFNRRG